MTRFHDPSMYFDYNPPMSDYLAVLSLQLAVVIGFVIVVVVCVVAAAAVTAAMIVVVVEGAVVADW